MENNFKTPHIALGTWSWGAGFAGGDQVFGNHLHMESKTGVDTRGSWEHPMV